MSRAFPRRSFISRSYERCTLASHENNYTTATNLGHVHVVNEIDELLVSRRSVVASSLLLQRLFQDALQHLGSGVEVERHVGDGVVLAEFGQFVVDDDRLAEPGVTNQHDGPLEFHQHVHEEANSGRLSRVYERRLHRTILVILSLASVSTPIDAPSFSHSYMIRRTVLPSYDVTEDKKRTYCCCRRHYFYPQ